MELYELWKPLMRDGTASFWQEFYVKFYQAFIDGKPVEAVPERRRHHPAGHGHGPDTGHSPRHCGGRDPDRPRPAADRDTRNPILGLFNGICKVYVTVIRGTPMMVQLLIMGFVIFSFSRNYTMVGALTLGINSGAYVSEIIRGGLMSLDPGQAEAGRSLGLGYIDTMRLIVIPQAFKAILPALGNEFIMLLKDTSLITVIGGKEMVYAAQAIYGRTYEQMFPLIGIACIYLVLVMVFSWLQSLLERRLRQSDRR